MNMALREQIVERYVNGIQNEEEREKRGELGDSAVRC